MYTNTTSYFLCVFVLGVFIRFKVTFQLVYFTVYSPPPLHLGLLHFYSIQVSDVGFNHSRSICNTIIQSCFFAFYHGQGSRDSMILFEYYVNSALLFRQYSVRNADLFNKCYKRKQIQRYVIQLCSLTLSHFALQKCIDFSIVSLGMKKASLYNVL